MQSNSRFPAKRSDWSQLKAQMETGRGQDVPWHDGRSFKPAYYAGEEVLEVATEAYAMYINQNALYSRSGYPSLHQYESEVVAMMLEMLNAPEGAGGNLTTGGTETNFMAVKTARDWARSRNGAVDSPQIIVPRSAHPSFDKAGEMLGVEVVRMRHSPDYLADIEAMAAHIGERTIMLVGSAPPYPYGQTDPIAEIAALARDHHLWMHVDGCLGGFILPFARERDPSIPDFDLGVPGVTSISADIHKYGYAAKGVSALLLVDAGLEEHQRSTFDDWPSGLYSTANVMGSRSGGAVASAWAVMNHLGREGYTEIVSNLIDVRERFVEGIESVEGLKVIAKPHAFNFAFLAEGFDIYAVADGMIDRGWTLGRAAEPPSIQLMINLSHQPVVEAFVDDLAQVSKDARTGRITARTTDSIYAI